MQQIFIRTIIIILFISALYVRLYPQVILATINIPVTEDFNTLVTTGTGERSTLPTGWVLLETGSGANSTYSVGTGTSSSGNTYSFGTTAERSLGSIRSGSLIPTIGASFINITGAIITSLEISYAGEQWRLGATQRTTGDRLDFQFSTNATSLETGLWTDFDGLDFIAPIIAGTAGALNGNTARTIQTLTISGISIYQGSTFWIRWNDFDVSGADDGLGIDDFSIIPKGIPGDQPNIVFKPSSLEFGEISIGERKTLTYYFDCANLSSDSATLIIDNTAFTLSSDSLSFTNSISAAENTKIFVRFTPAADGSFSDTIMHINDTFRKALSVQGKGYDAAAHIIPIEQARTQAIGSRVTVTGRVTVANQQGSPSYLQDATGGIPAFSFDLSNSVEIGDSLVVTGPVSLFYDQVQISGTGITFFKADNSTRIISPKQIALQDLATNEGLLVTVFNVEFLNKAFVFYPQSTETISTGSFQADLRIDGDTDIPGFSKPKAPTNITGVVGRFQSHTQLLPRFRNDVPGATYPQTSTDTIPVTATFDLMNWNLDFFGAQREDYLQEYGPTNEPLQRDNAAKVILAAKPDLLAVQEVSNPFFFGQLMELLPGYSSACSPRFSHDFDGDHSFPPQKVCFIYDTTTVRVISVRPMFEKLFDDARTTAPELLPGIPGGNASSFWSSGRLPFMLTADITINKRTERIRFIDLHSKSGATLDDMNRRKYDMQFLKDSLDAYFANDKLVILGDINDDLDQSIVRGQPSPYDSFIRDSAHYKPITLRLSQEGARSTISFEDVIDHQILSNRLQSDYLDGSAHIFIPFAIIPNYATTTSDHLPVLSRYKFMPIDSTAPTISFEKTNETFREGSGAQTIKILLSEPSQTKETVTISASDSDTLYWGQLLDYTTNPAQRAGNIRLEIPANASEVNFNFTPESDLFDEDLETIKFSIVLVTGGIKIGEHSVTKIHIEDLEPCLPVFAVYPNPTSGQVSIVTFPSNEKNLINGTLIDTNGQQLSVLTGAVAELSKAFTIALEGKRNGIYIIKLKMCDKVITKRIVKW
ncbi:MAG: T9SS type A sorting domain-containing protein [Chryseolinea sp.]